MNVRYERPSVECRLLEAISWSRQGESSQPFIHAGCLYRIYRASKAEVAKKAKTIFSYADTKNEKRVSLEQFRMVANMFPSLLFPGSHTHFEDLE